MSNFELNIGQKRGVITTYLSEYTSAHADKIGLTVIHCKFVKIYGYVEFRIKQQTEMKC